jgi:hypothetical protein
MKTYMPLGIYSITAAAALTKNLFIGLTGDVCGANAKALGVCDTDTAITEQCPVVTHGIALVTSGAAFNVGDALVSNSAGKAIAATTLSATVPSTGTPVTSSSAQPAMTLAGSILPQVILGYALDTVGAADLTARILLV